MTIRDEYPLAYKALSAVETDQSGGPLQHILSLESGWSSRLKGESKESVLDPDSSRKAADCDAEYDVVVAGGGLSLLYAIQLARSGFKVAVLDRKRVASSHREWNASFSELDALVGAGLFSEAQVLDFIDLRYERGIVRWHNGREHSVEGVLDCAVSSRDLLAALRSLAQAQGVEILDFHRYIRYFESSRGLCVEVSPEDGERAFLFCRLLLDARGVESDHGQFDILCPTVGGVISGLDTGSGPRKLDSKVGEILVSTEGIEDGRQHIWEGFPLSGDLLTTYLFYYASPQSLGERPLLSLYERFFANLSRYKSGKAILERPTYGIIPGNSRLRSCSLSPGDRIYLVGDAASRHSPLTFCGFGAIIRSFESISTSLARLLDSDRLDRASLDAVRCEREGLRVMGGLALMMVADRQRLPCGSNLINSLLDDAFAALKASGQINYRNFMQDEIGFYEFLRYMLEVARHRPTVWQEVFRQLSPEEAVLYFRQILAFGIRDLVR